MIHSIRWLGPLILSAAALVGADAAAQGSDAAQPKDAQAPRDSAAAEQGGASKGSVEAEAKADDFDRTPKDCITISNIRDTAVVDDSTILFYMRGGSKVTYRTSLNMACPNLARENRFAYKVPINRLCSSDLITVLEQSGVGLREGFTCRLGLFYPIPYDEAELLRKEHDHPNSTRGGVKTKPVEVAPKKSETPPAASEPAPQSERAPPGEQAPPSQQTGDSAPR